jgi:hypothetical protein
MPSRTLSRRRVLLAGAAAAAGAARVVRADPAIQRSPLAPPGTLAFADASRGRPFSKDPSCVKFKGEYLLYYSLGPGNGVAGWSAGVARSRNLADWEKAGEILPEGECEKKGIAAPNALVHGGKVHLFYQTYGNGKDDAICHAVSDDGVRFRRNPSNPVFKPSGAWTCGRAIDAEAIAWKGRVLLFWATRDPAMKVQMLGMAGAAADSDFGRDAWTQLGDGPILKPELPWERRCIEAPAACARDGRLYLFYAGGYNNEPQQIGCAVSDDGVAWTRCSDAPLLPNGAPGTWNESESGHPGVLADDDGSVRLFYQGNADRGKTWYLSWVNVAWEGGKPSIKPGP